MALTYGSVLRREGCLEGDATHDHCGPDADERRRSGILDGSCLAAINHRARQKGDHLLTSRACHGSATRLSLMEAPRVREYGSGLGSLPADDRDSSTSRLELTETAKDPKSSQSSARRTMASSQSEKARQAAHEKRRAEMMVSLLGSGAELLCRNDWGLQEDFERQRAELAKDAERNRTGSDRFVGISDSTEEALKMQSIGLVRLEDFQQRRQALEEERLREAAQTSALKCVTSACLAPRD